MRRATSAPFLLAPDDTVSGAPWKLVVEDGESAVIDAVPAWDPAMDLWFRRTVIVRPAEIRAACRLPGDARLRLVSLWKTGSALRDCTCRVDIDGDAVVSTMLEVRAKGSDLSQTITLSTVLTLADSVPSAPLRPFRAGSVLWDDEHQLLLEGGGSRFPMELIPFSRSFGFPPRAAWMLDWQPVDLDLPVLGAMRLYLNQDHEVIARAVAEPTDPRSQVIMASIQFDVARQLIRGALCNPEFVQRDTPYEKETVGRAIQRLLKSRFKGQTPAELRNELDADPDRFDAVLQDKVGLFGGLS